MASRPRSPPKRTPITLAHLSCARGRGVHALLLCPGHSWPRRFRLILPRAVHRFEYSVYVRQEELLIARRWIGNRGHPDALDGGGQHVEEIVHEPRRHLGAHP